MPRSERKPLEDRLCVKLTKRYAAPAEWIGEMASGETIYIVGRLKKLLIAIADDMWAALRMVKDGDCMSIPSGHWNSAVSTADMLKATGINLKCAVEEKIAGEVSP